MMKKLLLLCCLASFSCNLFADEGMWLPLLINKNVKDMQKMGMKLTAADLYNANQSSLKDAVASFGGCTAEMISPDGLMLTNHHCGYGQIQAHSSVEHDYLTNGFWAKKRSEELPNPGMFARFLVRMEDVSNKVLADVTSSMSESERANLIKKNAMEIIKHIETFEKGYTAVITPIFNENQYLLFVYEVFTDVRLVGAPPSAIGKFGGDTDNWMWPRHTGDFSLFRVYANRDNKPAPYSPTNVPYKPKKYFTISVKGIKENEFTLVYGFPGTTQEYLPSYAIENVLKSNPHKIRLRDERLKLMNSFMNQSPAVRIQYASKSAGVANAWKKWIGERKGLERLNAVEVKQEFENRFADWVNSSPELQKKYANLLPKFKELYEENYPLSLVNDYYNEAFRAIEMVSLMSRFTTLVRESKKERIAPDTLDMVKKDLIKWGEAFFKNYHLPYDKQISAIMMKEYYNNVPAEYRPAVMDSLYKACNGDFESLMNKAFESSKFADLASLTSFIEGYTPDKLGDIESDFFFSLSRKFAENQTKKVTPRLGEIRQQLGLLQRLYMRAQIEMQPDKTFYPDANSTLRVSYGTVKGFEPTDGVIYDYYTTVDGIIEKDNPNIYDYRVPTKLRQLWEEKDYGPYAMKSGQMPVAFIATNHTSGGNSGSPVLNSKGELIGLNFDRCWESTMSDYMFDPDYCRNISVDIRYVLFIIDKFAGANHLIDEMSIVY